jgi:hypothetical protein
MREELDPDARATPPSVMEFVREGFYSGTVRV